jgi:UDP-glucose 4-epimerase
MRILVTGASGFLGTPLLCRLQEKGHTILALSRGPLSIQLEEQIIWLQADLQKPEEYQEPIRNFLPEAVIHLAWTGLPVLNLTNARSSVSQTIKLFDFLVRLKCCRKFLMAGSCWEAGITRGSCHEQDYCRDGSDFVRAKNQIRRWIEEKSKTADFVFAWMRIFYVYGPRQLPKCLIPTIIRALCRGQPPKLEMPLSAHDFVFIDDIVEAFVRAVELDFRSGVFNLGSGRPTSVIKICELVEKLLSGESRLTREIGPISSQYGTEIKFWANIESARRELGWTPQIDIQTGIAKSVEWFQHHA